MAYQGKSIKCSECGTTFTFTAGQQAFYAFKGRPNEPNRCSPCSAMRKTQHNGDADFTFPFPSWPLARP
jgi:hypothetical protein